MTDPLFLLKRKYKEATCGTLCDEANNALFFTLEPPLRNNAKDNPNTPENEAGCIPEGEYLVVRRDPKIWSKARYKDNWEILNIPNKSGVVFHSGNYWFHSQSCILLGKSIIDMNPRGNIGFNKDRRWFLNNSALALKEFTKMMPERFKLKIMKDENA